MAGQTAAFSVQRGGAAIDVVVAGSARGELELAEAKAGAGKKCEELLGVRRFSHYGDCRRGVRELAVRCSFASARRRVAKVVPNSSQCQAGTASDWPAPCARYILSRCLNPLVPRNMKVKSRKL